VAAGPPDSENPFGLTPFEERPSLEQPREPLDRPAPGMRLGLWLLWLCFGLPTGSLLFLGIPALLALFAVGMLERASVPLEVWSELEPWIALLLLTAAVHWRASFSYRRSVEGRPTASRWWFILGGTIAVVWLGLFRLEQVPRTVINPVLHYVALSAVMVWSALTLAWVGGRIIAYAIGRVERRALRSATLRGSLATAGPLCVLSIAAVGATALGVDADNAVDDTRALVENSFKNDWSLGDGGSSPGGESGSRRRPEPGAWFGQCIEQIYRGNPSLFDKAVAQAARRRHWGNDPESIAADAAIAVCSRTRPEQLDRYYLRAVSNRANTAYERDRRFGECPLPVVDPYPIPSDSLEDCVRQSICRMNEDDQDALVNFLQGETALELAARRQISFTAAEKRISRAKKRLRAVAQDECRD
jgi:DNA-directed RNA polymerase specialized sigma24 family protein